MKDRTNTYYFLIAFATLIFYIYGMIKSSKANHGDEVVLMYVKVKKIKDSYWYKAKLTYTFYYNSKLYTGMYTRPNVFKVEDYLNKCFKRKVEKGNPDNRTGWREEEPCECPPELLRAIDSAKQVVPPQPPPTAVPERPLEDIPQNNTYWPGNR